MSFLTLSPRVHTRYGPLRCFMGFECLWASRPYQHEELFGTALQSRRQWPENWNEFLHERHVLCLCVAQSFWSSRLPGQLWSIANRFFLASVSQQKHWAVRSWPNGGWSCQINGALLLRSSLMHLDAKIMRSLWDGVRNGFRYAIVTRSRKGGAIVTSTSRDMLWPNVCSTQQLATKYAYIL